MRVTDPEMLFLAFICEGRGHNLKYQNTKTEQTRGLRRDAAGEKEKDPF